MPDDSSQHFCALAIAGLDPSGGAGLPADIRAMRAFDVHCCGVATAVIAQNTRGVARCDAVADDLLAAQLDNILADIAPRALKIGLLPTVGSIKVVAERLKYFDGVPIVIDPVFAPSSGAAFSNRTTIDALCEMLLPHAELVTPNLPEAQQLSGLEITNVDSLHAAARWIQTKFGVRNVLIKGGHSFTSEPSQAIDWLWNGRDFREFRAPFQSGIEVRGTGCLLASAIAAQRAQQRDLGDAISQAKTWLGLQIENAHAIGKGRRVTY